MFFLIPLSFGIISLFPFLYFRVKEKRVIAVYFKAFVSLMFILTALIAGLHSKIHFNVYILIGLFFGLLGDVFLDLKYIVTNKEDFYTKLGFISFAFGHLCYLLGLLLYQYDYSKSSPLYYVIPIIVTLILSGVTLLMEKVTPIRYKKMKPFVVIYGLFLFFTTSMYMSVAIQSGFSNTTVVIMAFALILFMISDLILNNTYFSNGCNTPIFVISNHVTYYIAQFLIAVSLFFLI